MTPYSPPQTPRLGHLSGRPERRDGDPAAATAWIAGLLGVLGAVHGHGKWQCPAHDGNSPALALRAGDRGTVLYCHAGCDTADVLATLGLLHGHLFTPPDAPPALWARARCSHIALPPMTVTSSPQAAGYRHECFHYYGDRYRKERLRQPSTGRKEIRWEHRGAGGEWNPGLFGTKESELPLYRERDLAMAIGASEPIVLVESESSVDALVTAGIYATTWAGGAGSPPIDTLRRVLGDYDRVVFVADADDAGRHCAASLVTLGIVTRIVPGDTDGGSPGDDARDLLARLGAAGLSTLIADPGPDPDRPPADVTAVTARAAELLPNLPAGTRVTYDPQRDHLHLYRARSEPRALVDPSPPPVTTHRRHPVPAPVYLSRSVHPAATATAWRWEPRARRWIRRDLDDPLTDLSWLYAGAARGPRH